MNSVTRSIVWPLAVIAFAAAAVVNETDTPTDVLHKSNNGTQPATPQDGDKVFVEWIYGLIGQKPPTTTTTTTTELPEPEKCPSCSCGLTNKRNRIVGGVETQVNQYPWMALLMYKGRFYCGGSVINSRYVLTAAHCVDRFDARYVSVRILEHDRNTTTETEAREIKVEQLIKHSGYSTFNYNNDIALIKLKDAIAFEGPMRPVCLPDRGKTFSGSMAIATGWGALEEGGPISNTLQEVMVPILSNAECRATKYPARRITDNMLCAGFKEGSKDACQGDSGGPLHVETNNIHQIVGVVSWGEGCAQPNYPGVYARVNRFLSWIMRNTPDACYC